MYFIDCSVANEKFEVLHKMETLKEGIQTLEDCIEWGLIQYKNPSYDKPGGWKGRIYRLIYENTYGHVTAIGTITISLDGEVIDDRRLIKGPEIYDPTSDLL